MPAIQQFTKTAFGSYSVMALKIIAILVLLFISVKSSSLSVEEDLYLEEQLTVLNKPPIKTIEMGGYIMDCVDINKQPALDHPLLKNHKVQTRPTTFPGGIMPKTSSSIPSNTRQGREVCPEGSVAIRRTSKQDLIRAKSMPKLLSVDASNPSGNRLHAVNLAMKTDVPYFGVEAYVAGWNLTIAHDQQSFTTMWVQSGPRDQLNSILAGWTVSPNLYGDNLTRLFWYWTADSGATTGCYNQLCSGFVSTSTEITPGFLVRPTSYRGGDQFDSKFLVYQDRPTGNWWLVVSKDNKFVGYWPKELFNDLIDGAETVAWGGFAVAGESRNCPPMGSGYMPDGSFRVGCYFRNIHIVNDKNAYKNPGDDATVEYVDKTGCYGLNNQKNCGHDELYYCFTFGGPGCRCD
ncbi:hypothetical protein Dsin_030323 [Dipteronia sinensis]|uniref:Neprosin PEP catalytic domain-containing protein n=1 Tax=Dipteronia sinensis TaxID=43782 RepID=A0AAD9ZJD7_9ROSI|nr:hypothetical protein Dsin_030323 [Dipteronia sinensis]